MVGFFIFHLPVGYHSFKKPERFANHLTKTGVEKFSIFNKPIGKWL
jgi:hypothetical protein